MDQSASAPASPICAMRPVGVPRTQTTVMPTWDTVARVHGRSPHGRVTAVRGGGGIAGSTGDDWSALAGHHAGVDIDSFVRDGFAAVRQAVDADTAAACRDLIWTAIGRRGISQDDSGTCPPLVEAGSLGLSGEPFTAAYMAPALTAAYDELIGPGRWKPSVDIGEAVVVRFPSEDRANAGYHIEGSYPGPAGQHCG